MTLMIRGHKWEIILVDKIPFDNSVACGYTDAYNRKLFILKDTSEFLYLHTVFHELLHVIGYEYNLPLLYGFTCDEKLVDKVALVIAIFIYVSSIYYSKNINLLAKFIRIVFKKNLNITDSNIIFTYVSAINSLFKKGEMYNDKGNTGINK